METAAKLVRVGDPSGDPTDDRLSALPDELLHHVLSFLPSRRAVQTSVLSKRWTGLWRSVRRIDINIDVDSGHYGNSYSKDKWEKQENFINKMFKFHDAPSLDAFRIEIGSNHKDLLPTINRWVRRGIKQYRPLEIEIGYYWITGAYRLPRLRSSTALLKKMYLFSVFLEDSFQELLRSGCPVLEDLTLNHCCTYFRDIQSSTLRRFVLRNCYRSSEMLVIRAPALVSLTIFTLVHKNGVTLDGPMNSLVNASIHPYDGGYSHLCRVSLLGSLFNVTNLELTHISAEVMLDKELDKYPSFMNLKALSMTRCLDSKIFLVDGRLYSSCDPHEKFNALARLLNKAPNLERLTLENCWSLPESEQKLTACELTLGTPDQKAFDCPNLKSIEIRYRDDGTDDKHQMFQLVCGLVRNLQNPAINFFRIKKT